MQIDAMTGSFYVRVESRLRQYIGGTTMLDLTSLPVVSLCPWSVQNSCTEQRPTFAQTAGWRGGSSRENISEPMDAGGLEIISCPLERGARFIQHTAG
jgi:hypothetical protein